MKNVTRLVDFGSFGAALGGLLRRGNDGAAASQSTIDFRTEFESFGVVVDADQTLLSVPHRGLADVPDSITRFTALASIGLSDNCFSAVPLPLMAMTQLIELEMASNRIQVVAPEIARLSGLRRLDLSRNLLRDLPEEIGQLVLCETLLLGFNRLVRVPRSLGRLTALQKLVLSVNALSWLPVELEALPTTLELKLYDNPLPVRVMPGENCRPHLGELLATSRHLGTIRERAATACIGLAELELPALVTLKILDAAWPNDVRMAAKWDLIVAVKHFHDRNQRRL